MTQAHTVAAVLVVDVCSHGGTEIVSGFTKIIDIGKYLIALAVFVGAAIWLLSEFFKESQSAGDQGGFKVSTFIFHHTIPLGLLLLGVGLLLGFGALDLLGAGVSRPC